jgi:hypothetical protein
MMKRKLATILILVMIISLMIPAAASAATSYKATLKLSGPDKDGNDQSISSSASYLDPATTLQVMATSFGDMVEAAEEAFSGTGLGDDYADFYDTFTSGTDAEWAALVDEVTITPAGAAAIIKDRDSTIDDLVDVSKTITAEYTVNGDTYTLKLTLSSQSSGGGGGGSSGGSSSSTHSVTVENTENGTAKLSKSKAEKGDTVTITVTPDEGYEVASVTVTDADGKNIDVTKNSDGTYSFKMPNKKVKISVTFEKSEAEPEPEPEPEPTPEPVADRPFVDVKENDWFYEAVYYCYDQGWFKGVSDTEFAPKASMTRAMVVTVLWRLAGEPGVATTAPFSDVESGKWYSQAVEWAYNMGIIQGYGDGRFGVTDSVTREQLVVMLWRMLGKPAVTGDLSNFKDADKVSSWAKEAMSWAVGIGVINGDDTGALNPGGQATRAEVAQIMMNNLKGN